MTLKPVRKGTKIQMPATRTFGFLHKPAPVDGFAWDDGESCGFLSLREVENAVVALKMKQRNGWRR